MELTLLWWAGGVAGAVWLAAVVLQRPGAGVPARRCVIIGSCMAVSGFLVTLPSKPPFHAGQGLGMGFALGAVAATLAALACLGAGRIAARGGWLVSIAGATAPACIAVVIALVFLRGVRIDALTGVLLGWLATALVLQGRTAADDLESRLGPALTVGSLFAAAVALTSCLTAFRGASVVHSYAWAALVVIVAVSVPCALLLGGVLARASEAAASDVVAGASGALVIILTTWLATTRAFPSWLAHYEPERAFWCAIVGVAIGSLMAALSSVASKSASPPPWLGHLMLLLAVGATLPF
ncbi:MAG: hypothetical protein FJX72_02040, partial [Armatimonadetes bacterium]|nr:hypothetical protein [Armatimonadota bacterium]